MDLNNISSGDFSHALGDQAELAVEKAQEAIEGSVTALKSLSVIGRDVIADTEVREQFLGLLER